MLQQEQLYIVVQSRVNAPADILALERCDLLIDIPGLNQKSFHPDRTQATIQGGTLING